MKIAIGSDHAGFEYKNEIIKYLKNNGHEVEDFGTHSDEACNYPEFIRPVALAVGNGEFDRGIVLGGSGNGEAIVANRVPGVRCCVCWNVETAKLARHHNDSNVISIGQRMIGLEVALDLVAIWLHEPFEGGRHQARVDMIDG